MILKKRVSGETGASSLNEKKGISRRDFVHKAGKLTGAFAAGFFCLNGSSRAAFAADRSGAACRLSPVKMALRFEAKACASCRLCEIACAQYHEGDANHNTARNRLIIRPLLHFTGLSALSANAPGWPQSLANATYAEFSENHFCRHCPSPECLDACPENAISVEGSTGARVVDEEKCVGCGECVTACQFEMVRINEETGKAFKCDLCGGDPQCVRWCPTGAITLKRY
jgi:Fe-S-cluster-containing dehydrogenase component